MKYNCVLCNYLTNDHGNWAKHVKSKKHEQNSNNITKTTHNTPQSSTQGPPNIHKSSTKLHKNNKPKHLCNYCNNEFSRSDSLGRHLKYCQEKENKHKLLENQFEKYKKEKEIEFINKEETLKLKSEVEILREKLKSTEKNFKEKIKTIEEQKEQYKEHIETLKNENKFQKQLIESAGGMIKKSMNTMSYLLLNYNNAPQLQSLPDYSIMTKDTETLIKDLVHYHKKGTFEKYIGDFIVKQYKKDNPELQSIWSSDIERLNYFIRELMNNKNNNENNDTKTKKLNWIIDKKGIKVKKSIIDPLLDYIKLIGDKYLQEKNIIIENLSSVEASKLINDMKEIGDINCGIKNKSISENINKYIAPHFYLNK